MTLGQNGQVMTDQNVVVETPDKEIDAELRLPSVIDPELAERLVEQARADGERAKFWLQVLTEIKNRGTDDVCMVACDGLKGLPESINL